MSGPHDAGAVQVEAAPGWWHGPDGMSPSVTPGAGLAGIGSQAGPAVPVVWGGRPAWGWGRPDSEPAQGGTTLARPGAGLGVRVDAGPAGPARPPAPVNIGRPGPALGGPGQGGPGLGQDGQDRRRRRSLRKVIWDWFAAPLHESPDPIPAWLARGLLRCWPAQAGQEESTGTDSAGGSGAGAWAGTAVAVRGGGAR